MTSYVTFSRIRKGEVPRNAFNTNEQPPAPSLHSLMTICSTLVHPDRVDERRALMLTECSRPTISLPDIDALMDEIDETVKSRELPRWINEHLGSQEKSPFIAMITRFLFNTLLVLLSKPDLVERGALERRVMRTHGPQEFWRPTMLGERYRIKRPDGGGTHTSPRLHWVRGFWREQPYGPQGGLRRNQWIEPYIRGDG
jgi:hypothetical protein